MADMVTVLWHVNTYTSAPTTLHAARQQLILELNNDAAFYTRFINWCNANLLSPQQGLNIHAQNRLTRMNQRSAFTALNPDERLNELEAAVAKAREWASKKMGTPDLVFVAPEYLFAKDGYRHLLDADQVDNIKARLKAINKKHPQVLMFPGTIASRQPIAGQSVKARVRLYEDMNFWKIKGSGPTENWGDKNKKKIHDIAMRGPVFDMAQNKAFAFLNGKKLLEYTKRGDFHEVTAQDATGNEVYVPGKKAGNIQAFGRTFGTEVCLDHNMGYAKTTGSGQPDVHVIMSAAVLPVPEHEYCQGKNPGKTGFVIHASCEKSLTEVVKWENGARTVIQPTWEQKTGYSGTLRGYKLAFKSNKADIGFTGNAGNVAAKKAMFGG